MAQKQADALALLAETALNHGFDQELAPGAPGERYQVVVHVDVPSLADAVQPGQSVLEEGTRDLAHARPRFGNLRIWVLLRREGWPINRRRVRRLSPRARLRS